VITAIVQYRLPSNIDLKACAEHFRKIAPGFQTVQGLIRNQFIYAEDGWAGGVYLWKTRGRGSPASASATAWIRRSSISTPLA
jgi:hypothetical protein